MDTFCCELSGLLQNFQELIELRTKKQAKENKSTQLNKSAISEIPLPKKSTIRITREHR